MMPPAVLSSASTRSTTIFSFSGTIFIGETPGLSGKFEIRKSKFERKASDRSALFSFFGFRISCLLLGRERLWLAWLFRLFRGLLLLCLLLQARAVNLHQC